MAEPHHRNILVLLDGTVGEGNVTIFNNKNVFFYPASSEQTVTITFCEGVPFSNWDGRSTMTGEKGKPLKGKVDSRATGEFPYNPGSIACTGERANPKLIVDGG